MTSQYPQQPDPQHPQYSQPGYQPGYSPGYGQPQYQGGQGGPYQQPPYRYTPPGSRPPGPPALGVTGLVMAAVALVLSVVWDFITVAQFRDVMRQYSAYATDPLPRDAFSAFNTAIVVQLIASVIGIAALVISIVATTTNRGRGFAIGGIVVAAVAPIASYTIFFIALAALGLDPDIWNNLEDLDSGTGLLFQLVMLGRG